MFLPPLFTLVLAVAFAAPEAPAGAQAEVARIQEHLDGALALMASRDLSGLTPSQRTNRAKLTATLRAYRDRGAFPKNYDFPGERVPYFIDHRTGVLCAVGHLLAESGRRDVVDRVAAMDNQVRVMALAGDAEFVAWLDQHGLLLEEAARIQPWYGVNDNVAPPWYHGDEVHMAAIGTSLTFALINGIKPAGQGFSAGGALGLTAGLASIGLGVAAHGGTGFDALSLTTTLAGGATTVFALRAMFARPSPQAGASANRSTPLISPVIPMGSGRGYGVSVSLRF